MSDSDTVKLLGECNSGIQMAVFSIDEILEKVTDKNLYEILKKSKEKSPYNAIRFSKQQNITHENAKNAVAIAEKAKKNLEKKIEDQKHEKIYVGNLEITFDL